MKRARWRGGEVLIRSRKVVLVRWRRIRSRGGTWIRIDSRSSGVERTRSAAGDGRGMVVVGVWDAMIDWFVCGKLEKLRFGEMEVER